MGSLEARFKAFLAAVDREDHENGLSDRYNCAKCAAAALNFVDTHKFC